VTTNTLTTSTYVGLVYPSPNYDAPCEYDLTTAGSVLADQSVYVGNQLDITTRAYSQTLPYCTSTILYSTTCDGFDTSTISWADMAGEDLTFTPIAGDEAEYTCEVTITDGVITYVDASFELDVMTNAAPTFDTPNVDLTYDLYNTDTYNLNLCTNIISVPPSTWFTFTADNIMEINSSVVGNVGS
jgi:hypothetical protein